MKKWALPASVVVAALWINGIDGAQALDTESPPTGYPAPLAPDAVAPTSPAQMLPKAQNETVPSEPSPAAPKAKESSEVGRLGPARGSFVSLSTEKTDFNFKDADIIGILRAFAVKFNRNIIAGPGVSGRL